ncbi:hypothetical protein BD410DRAFT_732808 [Rickenella mellea]|uniref:HAT C-terminal dimerisation domain-containing protein n=1 Tax=Rickenella mellea TaxID=50990 RepID=A0A4Y7PIS3_9AGAM|nr:hypothetical protein BD410DRAFT_732808 [Rickenella mellea]
MCHLLATSTDVECAFSQGGLTVSKCRHALSDESTRAATILGSWAGIGGLIPEMIIQAFRDKSARPRQPIVESSGSTAPTTPSAE